jgi:hypothetical protein
MTGALTLFLAFLIAALDERTKELRFSTVF